MALTHANAFLSEKKSGWSFVKPLLVLTYSGQPGKQGGWEKSTIFNQEQINIESQSEMQLNLIAPCVQPEPADAKVEFGKVIWSLQNAL